MVVVTAWPNGRGERQNYLKMTDKRRVLALLELGWSYRRIERETGVRRETVARYDPRRQAKAANLSTGSESTSDELTDGEPNAANLSAGSSHAHGPPGVAEPYRLRTLAHLIGLGNLAAQF